MVETISDPVVDRIKIVLAGATTIKRDRVVNEIVNELVVYDGVGAGYGATAGAGVGQHKGATSCIRCRGFLYEKCKKQKLRFYNVSLNIESSCQWI